MSLSILGCDLLLVLAVYSIYWPHHLLHCGPVALGLVRGYIRYDKINVHLFSMASTRPVRIIQLSSKLLSADNGGDIELTSHRKAIAAASKNNGPNPSSSLKLPVPATQCSLPSTSQTLTHPSSPTRDRLEQSTNPDVNGNADDTPLPSNRKRRHIVQSESDDPESRATPSSSQMRRKYKKKAKAVGKSQFRDLRVYYVNRVLCRC